MSHGPGPRGPQQKAADFSGTWKRLLGELRPERARIILVVGLTTIAVVLNVVAPKILAHAMNILFEGIIGTVLGNAGLPAGLGGEALAQALNAAGMGEYAQMVSAYET